MKKIIALILLAMVGYFLVDGLAGMEGFHPYGEADPTSTISSAYLTKSATMMNEEVVFGQSKDLETGSANIVTDIIAMYRSFDTLGEVTVLFVSALGVSLLLGSSTGSLFSGNKPNFILQVGARLILPIIITVGVFVFTHGHLTPGGGFPGGAMIASGVLLLYLSNPAFRLNVKAFKLTESLSGMSYVLIGGIGLLTGSYFLENFLATGQVGSLVSGGIVPLVYVLVGLKVGTELSGLIGDFAKGEVQ